jgi:hypothetical protein
MQIFKMSANDSLLNSLDMLSPVARASAMKWGNGVPSTTNADIVLAWFRKDFESVCE